MGNNLSEKWQALLHLYGKGTWIWLYEKAQTNKALLTYRLYTKHLCKHNIHSHNIHPYSIQFKIIRVALFNDKIVAKKLYRKLSFYNRFI